MMIYGGLCVCVQASELYCLRMPNKFNFAFDNYFACLVTLATYVPGKLINLVYLYRLLLRFLIYNKIDLQVEEFQKKLST